MRRGGRPSPESRFRPSLTWSDRFWCGPGPGSDLTEVDLLNPPDTVHRVHRSLVFSCAHKHTHLQAGLSRRNRILLLLPLLLLLSSQLPAQSTWQSFHRYELILASGPHWAAHANQKSNHFCCTVKDSPLPRCGGQRKPSWLSTDEGHSVDMRVQSITEEGSCKPGD